MFVHSLAKKTRIKGVVFSYVNQTSSDIVFMYNIFTDKNIKFIQKKKHFVQWNVILALNLAKALFYSKPILNLSSCKLYSHYSIIERLSHSLDRGDMISWFLHTIRCSHRLDDPVNCLNCENIVKGSLKDEKFM